MLLKNQLIKTLFLRPFEFNLMSQWILSDGVISGNEALNASFFGVRL